MCKAGEGRGASEARSEVRGKRGRDSRRVEEWRVRGGHLRWRERFEKRGQDGVE